MTWRIAMGCCKARERVVGLAARCIVFGTVYSNDRMALLVSYCKSMLASLQQLPHITAGRACLTGGDSIAVSAHTMCYVPYSCA
jgi:hypothetical protein